jgi:hypothetical protein
MEAKRGRLPAFSVPSIFHNAQVQAIQRPKSVKLRNSIKREKRLRAKLACLREKNTQMGQEIRNLNAQQKRYDRKKVSGPY